MPNVLILSFEGFSFSARQLYEQLLPTLLSRAIVHESLTIRDALYYIHSGWPSTILVTDAVIASSLSTASPSTSSSNQSQDSELPSVFDAINQDSQPLRDCQLLLNAVARATKHGCTTILMGFFAQSVPQPALDKMFQSYFGLRWESCGESYANLETILATPDQHAIRAYSLAKSFHPEAVYLRRVPTPQAVYVASHEGGTIAFAALGKAGLGKLGYVGDVNFSYESERIILAMCHLDRPDIFEDAEELSLS